MTRSLVPAPPAQPKAPAVSVLAPEARSFFRPIDNHAFQAPEELVYSIHFKGMRVGAATLRVEKGEVLEGRPTLRLSSRARSSPLFDRFFKVRDFNVAVVDQASLASIAFHQNLREGRYRVVRDVRFDYGARKWTYRERKSDQDRHKSGALNAPVFDILASIFLTRTLELASDQKKEVRVFHRGQFLTLPVKVGKDSRQVRVPAGTFDTWRVQPEVEGDTIFRSEKGELVIWMTKDARKIPVLIEAEIPVGKVSVRLRSMKRSLTSAESNVNVDDPFRRNK